jgi:2,4-diaminopentanoate dehydrogenase
MGVIALRGVIDHPELELVDLVVHSDSKAGRDGGELCGAAFAGVTATRDPSAMLAGPAEVVVYAAAANTRPLEAVHDMAAALRAGKNVVSCSVVPLVFPDAVDSALTDPLRVAAAEGDASFFTTGIDSGFANDILPLALSGLSRSIESIRVTELFNYATYPDTVAVYEILGFGKDPADWALAAAPGIFTVGWGPVVHQLAQALGVAIDRIDENNERVTTDTAFDTPTGHLAAGTVAAMRSTLTAFVDGRPTLVVDHVTRMRDDIAPHWPQPHIACHPRTLATGRHRDRGCTASRSRAPPTSGASSRWPRIATTTSVPGSRAPRDWSTPSRP